MSKSPVFYIIGRHYVCQSSTDDSCRRFYRLLGALSFLLMSFEFPLPFAPAYMKFEISDMPALFGGFFLGPIAGALAAFVKILLKLVIIGTNSALVGEVMNLFCSIAYVVPSTIFYHLHHSKKGALYALVSGSHCQASLPL